MALPKVEDIVTEKDKRDLYDLLDSFDRYNKVFEYFKVYDNSSNYKKLYKLAEYVGFDLKIYKQRYKQDHLKKLNKCLNCGKLTNNNKFCSRSCSATYNNKLRGALSDNTKNKIKQTLNRYYNNETKEPKYSVCEYCGQEFEIGYKKNGKLRNRKYCSKECSNKAISEFNKKINNGGFKEGSVKNYKSGWYKGIHCDSSWELAFLIWCFDHNINVKRCNDVREYIFDNVRHKYYPDFITDDGIIEIKGIKNIESELKQKYNPDIIFLYKDDMKKYLDYVISKYGDYIKLYDKKDK